MNNLILFINAFLSYLLVYLISLTTIVIAVILGIRWRKSKNKKEVLAASSEIDPN